MTKLTEKEFEIITVNLGIRAERDRFMSPFGEACCNRSFDELLAAHSRPADVTDRQNWGLTAVEWARGIEQALAALAADYLVIDPEERRSYVCAALDADFENAPEAHRGATAMDLAKALWDHDDDIPAKVQSVAEMVPDVEAWLAKHDEIVRIALGAHYVIVENDDPDAVLHRVDTDRGLLENLCPLHPHYVSRGIGVRIVGVDGTWSWWLGDGHRFEPTAADLALRAAA